MEGLGADSVLSRCGWGCLGSGKLQVVLQQNFRQTPEANTWKFQGAQKMAVRSYSQVTTQLASSSWERSTCARKNHWWDQSNITGCALSWWSRVRDWHPDGCGRAGRLSEQCDSPSLGAEKGRALQAALKQAGYCWIWVGVRGMFISRCNLTWLCVRGIRLRRGGRRLSHHPVMDSGTNRCVLSAQPWTAVGKCKCRGQRTPEELAGSFWYQFICS